MQDMSKTVTDGLIPRAKPVLQNRAQIISEGLNPLMKDSQLEVQPKISERLPEFCERHQNPKRDKSPRILEHLFFSPQSHLAGRDTDLCIYSRDKWHFLQESANFYLRFMFERGWKFVPIMQHKFIMTTLEMQLAVSFAMLTRLWTALMRFNSRMQRGANCAEVAGSNMRARNWRTRSVCVKDHLHITSTVFVRRRSFINWNACSVRGRPSIWTPFLCVCLSVRITRQNL